MKKTLALVLALVMVIGMMAVPASAAYTDAADIQYTEAVDVMSAIGIIEGYNNEFNPKGELTRAAGAKLVAYLELGAKQAEALTAENAPFADVPADHWAAGYIGWAAAKGYLAGVGDNKFAPDAPLSALAYAKLLLCALGYDAAIEGFTGNGWEYNVMSLALADAIDLFDGNDDADFAAAATREEAALYSFNALMAPTVKYDSKGTQVEINGAVISTGASDVKDVTCADTEYKTIKADTKVFLAEKLYKKLTLSGSQDAYGRPANVWKYDGDSVGTYSETPVATFTKQVKENDIYDAIGEEGFQGADNKYIIINKIFHDGNTAKVVASVDGKTATITTGSATPYAGAVYCVNEDESKVAGSGNGQLVEIYETDVDGVYTMVCVSTYVGKIDDWSAADSAKGLKERVTVVGLNGGDVADMTIDTTAFSEDDEDETIVLFTVANGEIKSVAKAEKVEAFVEETGASSFVADGVTYKYAQNFYGDKAVYDKDADNTVLYLDKYGYVINTDKVASADPDYAYVLKLGSEKDKFNSYKYYAQLLMPTGEKVTVETDKDYSGENTLADDVVSYEVNDDGEYELKKVVDKVAKTAAVSKGKVAIDLKDSDVVRVNSKTTFVVQTTNDDGDKVYTAYTGYAAVPSYNATAYAVIANEDNAKLADIVYLFGATEKASAADKLIYVAYESKASAPTVNANGEYFTVNAIVEGEITTLKLDADLFAAEGTLYGTTADFVLESITTNSKGVVTGVDMADGSADYLYSGSKTVKVTDELLGVAGGLFTYTDDTVVYTIDADGVIAESSVGAVKTDNNDTVIYSVDEDDATVITALYITIVK